MAEHEGRDREDILGLTLISVAVGLVLAVAYHVSASRFQTRAIRGNATAAPAVAMLGFVIRLAIIAGVLIVLGLATTLDMLALCLAFVALFTILNIWSVYSLMSKRRDVPPSTGTPTV